MRTMKGEPEYKKFRRGLKLSMQEAITANCFSCNGRDDTPCSADDSCPLHAFSPFKGNAPAAEKGATQSHGDGSKE